MAPLQPPASTTGERNAAWQQRSLASVWHPCTQMQRAAAVPPLPVAVSYTHLTLPTKRIV